MVGYESKVANDVTKDIIRKYNLSKEAFMEQDEESRNELQEFTFICELAFDVFVKKMMIEQFIAGREVKSEDENSTKENPKESK